MATDIQALIEEATFDFSIGDSEAALEKLRRATHEAPDSFDAWHALCEILFGERRFDEALAAAEAAHRIRPDDIFINTSLSRIWMEKGDKATAEHYGARARVLGWKDQLGAKPPAEEENKS
jgi:cytochrome c-type biogenesis protein CcmH/NrfG